MGGAGEEEEPVGDKGPLWPHTVLAQPRARLWAPEQRGAHPLLPRQGGLCARGTMGTLWALSLHRSGDKSRGGERR